MHQYQQHSDQPDAHQQRADHQRADHSRRSVLLAGATGLAAGLLTVGLGPVTTAAAFGLPTDSALVPRTPMRLLGRTAALHHWSVRPFPLSDIGLTSGVPTRAQDQMLHFLREFPADRVLAVFRRNAAIDTRGAEAPGGWEGFGHAEEEPWGPDDYPGRENTTTENLLRGHWGGHFLSASALAWASTGEQVFKDKVDQIVGGLAEVQVALAATGRYTHPGFLAAYGEWQFSQLEKYAPYGEIWAPYYTCHKIMAGLRDAYQLAGNDQALTIATSMAEWVGSRLDDLPDAQLQKMWSLYIAGEYGGMNEVLTDLTTITGEERYTYTATRFDLRELIDACADGVDTLDGKHSNQHIPQFVGYLNTYDLTDDKHYLDAVTGFWGMVVPGRTYAHGGNGEAELFGPANTVAGDIGARNAETCATYNMLKVSRLLYLHTLDAKYMEFYERGLLNQIIGSKRDAESATDPDVTYMFGVNPGTTREYGNMGTCCGGTGMENHVKYRDSIYFRSADGDALHVNLYLASTLEWPERGLRIMQETDYPRAGSSRLTVHGSGRLDLHLRVPGWVRKGFTVHVNGRPQRLDAVPGTYVTVSRTWSDGDVVDIGMPLGIRAVPTIDDPGVQSVEWGPTVLLARSAATEYLELTLYPHMALDGTVDDAFEATGDGYFRHGDLTFEPAWSGDSTEYHMYVRRHEPAIVFAGDDSGVANVARPDGTTFLDAVWRDGGFRNHGSLVAAVRRTANGFVADGLLTVDDGERVVRTAAEATFA